VASAKNPRRWGICSPAAPATWPSPGPGCPGPETSLRSDDPALIQRLSQRLGTAVHLLDQPPAGANLDQNWPPVEGRDFQDVTNELVMPAGTFFDAASIHRIEWRGQRFRGGGLQRRGAVAALSQGGRTVCCAPTQDG
jgi:hypothetical protein